MAIFGISALSVAGNIFHALARGAADNWANAINWWRPANEFHGENRASEKLFHVQHVTTATFLDLSDEWTGGSLCIDLFARSFRSLESM